MIGPPQARKGDYLFNALHNLPYGQATGKYASECKDENLLGVKSAMLVLPYPTGEGRRLLIRRAYIAASSELAKRKKLKEA